MFHFTPPMRVCRGIVLLLVVGMMLGLQPSASCQALRGEKFVNLLDREVDVDFRGVHFQDVAETLSERAGVAVKLDIPMLRLQRIETDKAKALETHAQQLRQVASGLRETLAKAGIGLRPDDALFRQLESLAYPGVTFTANQMRLGDVFYHILSDLGLDVMLDEREETLYITSQEATEISLVTRVYDVGELVATHDTDDRATPFDNVLIPEGPHQDYETLIRLLQNLVQPTTWDENGGNGSIAVSGDGTLTVSQTDQNHALVRAALAGLHQVRQARQAEQPEVTPIQVYVSDSERRHRQRMRTKLAKRQDLDLGPAHLYQVLDDLSGKLEIPIAIEPSVDQTLLASLVGEQEATDVVLERMLASLDPPLAMETDHGAIVVRSADEVSRQQHLVLYPVWDLVPGPSAQSRSDAWDVSMLMDSIMETIDPGSWDQNGGNGGIAADVGGDILAVAQTDDVHQKVTQLLSEFRHHARRRDEGLQRKPPAEKSEYSTVVFRLWQPWSEKALVREDDVVDLLQEMSEPESWNADEVFVRTLPSRLIIRQRRSVHRQVYELLQQLAILKPIESAGGAGGGGFGGGGMGGSAAPGAAGTLPPAGD